MLLASMAHGFLPVQPEPWLTCTVSGMGSALPCVTSAAMSVLSILALQGFFCALSAAWKLQ